MYYIYTYLNLNLSFKVYYFEIDGILIISSIRLTYPSKIAFLSEEWP